MPPSKVWRSSTCCSTELLTKCMRNDIHSYNMCILCCSGPNPPSLLVTRNRGKAGTTHVRWYKCNLYTQGINRLDFVCRSRAIMLFCVNAEDLFCVCITNSLSNVKWGSSTSGSASSKSGGKRTHTFIQLHVLMHDVCTWYIYTSSFISASNVGLIKLMTSCITTHT